MPDITAALLTRDIDDANLTVYTTASITVVAGRYEVAAVLIADTNPAGIPALAGAGVPWAHLGSIEFDVAGTRRTGFLFGGVAPAGASGTVTITATEAVSGCGWCIVECTNVNTAVGVVQVATGSGSSTSLLASLATFASSGNATLAALFSDLDSVFTAGAGFSIVGQDVSAGGSPTQAIGIEFRADSDQSVDATIPSAAAWGVVAIELAATVAAVPAEEPEGIRYRVYAAFGVNPGEVPSGGDWVELAQRVKNLEIRRGRESEFEQPAPGTLRALLSGLDRALEPNYAAGPYYPDVVPLTPIKVEATVTLRPYVLDLPGVSGSFASTPHSAMFDITGDVEIRGKNSLDDWTPAVTNVLASIWPNTGAQSWRVYVNATSGTLVFAFWDAVGGATSFRTSTVAPTVADGSALVWRVTRAAATGNTTFYTSPDDGASWEQLGAVVPGPAGNLTVSAAPLMVGGFGSGSSSPAAGHFSWLEVRNGIGGTVVASPDFTKRRGSTPFVDDQGNVWTLNGAAAIVADTPTQTVYPRFYGYADTFAPSWNTLGEVVLTATDPSKTWQAATLDVPYVMEVRRRRPIGYWRLNDPTGSTSLADASGRGRPGSIAGTPLFGEIDAVTDNEFGAMKFPGGSFAAFEARLTASTGFSVVIWFRHSTLPPGVFRDYPFYWWGSLVTGYPTISSESLITPESVSVGRLQSVPGGARYDDDAWHMYVQTRDSVTIYIYVDGVEVANFVDPTGAKTADTLVIAADPTFSGLWDEWIDEPAVFDYALSAADVAAMYAARTAWRDEATGTRVATVAEIIEWQGTVDADAGQSTLQSAGDIAGTKALQHLYDVARWESGSVFFDRAGRLRFVERHAKLRSTTPAATFGDAAGELRYKSVEPESSESTIRNEVRARRTGGALVVARDEDSIRRYFTRTFPDSGEWELKINSDGEVNDFAQWIVNHYKDPLFTIRRMVVQPYQPAYLADRAPPILGLELEDRVRVRRRPHGGTLSETDHFVMGYTELWGKDVEGRLQFAFALSPADAKEYWVLGTALLGVGTRLGY